MTLEEIGSGVFLQELMQNFELFRSGKETFKMRFFVGHDGTMIRVASALGLGILAPLRWPALGSEIVMEVRSSRRMPQPIILTSVIVRYGK